MGSGAVVIGSKGLERACRNYCTDIPVVYYAGIKEGTQKDT